MKSPLLAMCAAAAALTAGCGQGPAQAGSAAGAPAAGVRLATARASELALTIESPGTVRPRRSAQVAAKVMGAIEEMPVALGQGVRAGDPVARIAADEISARAAQARAQLNAAGRDLERERDLLGRGASTAQTVRDLEDRFAGAQAVAREAEDMLGYTTVRAPFDGTVSRKFAGVGDLASPGTPLVEIEDSGGFEVEAPIPDSAAGRLEPGAEIEVAVPGRGVTFKGRLVELSSSADPEAHTVTARIAVPAGIPLRSGEYARVGLRGAAEPALMVPASAVTTVGQMQRVFVAGPDGRASLRLVRTGAARGGQVEVLSGIDAGERVVVAPPPGLRDGQALEILP